MDGYLVLVPDKNHGTIYVEDCESARRENSRAVVHLNTERQNITSGREECLIKYCRKDFVFGVYGREDYISSAERTEQTRDNTYVSLRSR